MKKLMFTALALAIGVMSASAAKTAEELRIYINPGHGSWTPNDRPAALVGHGAYSRTNTDTLSFFESNTNLRKGFGVLEKLREYGLKFNASLNQTGERWQIGAALDMSNNIVMSHVKCGPYNVDNGTENQFTSEGKEVPADLYYYNRNLSEIAAEVEFNNFDMFISIHSNAATEGTNTNYPLFLYRGWDNCTVPSNITDFGSDTQAASKEMASKCWTYHYANEHQPWTYYSLTNMNLRGDISFYGSSSLNSTTGARSYLGVLHHNVPGFLVEGYFHTYQPSRHRAMNYDTDYMEGYAYARGIADYFGLTKESTGDIYGIVRDSHEIFSVTSYSPNTASLDKYKPLNGANITLKKDGATVATYVTDNYYNGAFVFKGVQPGNYTIEVTCANYKETTPINVTVKAAATSYANVQLENVNYVPPLYVNYPDPVEGYASEFNVENSYSLFGPYISTPLDLSGKTVRRQIYRDGVAYILALDSSNEPYIYAIKDGTVTELDKTGIALPANGILKLSDIALTADGVLVGCSYSKNHFSDTQATEDKTSRGVLNVYKWAKNESTGLPGTCSLWFTSQHSCNWYRCLIGRTIAYSGTLDEGYILMSGPSAAANNMRFASASILGGKLSGSVNYIDTINLDKFKPETVDSGTDYELGVSPNFDNNWVFDGDKVSPFEFSNNTVINGYNTLAPAAATGATYFKYAGHSFMVSPNVESGKVTGLRLFDISAGFGSATEITLNCSIDATSYGYASAHGVFEVTKENGVPVDSKIALTLIVDGKIYQWLEDASQIIVNNNTPNAFAYGITNYIEGMTFYVDYALNTDALKVEVVFINEDTEEEDLVIDLGSQTKGNHSESFNVSSLINHINYKWGIRVTSERKDKVMEFASYRFYHPRGVDVDNSFESPYFGNVYCTEGMSTKSSTYHGYSGNGGCGLYAFDAQMKPIKNPVTGLYSFNGGLTISQDFNGSGGYGADFSRVRVAEDGRIFVTRFNNSGSFIMVAPNFADLLENNTYTSLLSGYNYDSSTYNYTDGNGNFIAAPSLGFDIKGSGDELKLLSLSVNKGILGFSPSAARTDEYSLGNNSVLSSPSANIGGLTGKYTIFCQTTNVAYDNRGGVWYCQYRANPTDVEPALVYVDAAGVERYKDLVVRGGGGVRVSPDGTKLAAASSKTQFTIYNVEYNAEGTPSLSALYTITHGIGTNVYDIAWDLAGNIYICGNSGEYMKGFALPRTTPFITMAASKYYFKKHPTSVEDIEAETAEPEYYNLQGIKVKADNLTPGIYIRRTGSKIEKILIK